MKKIQLTKGKYAIVDDEDFENLNQHKWRAGVYKNIVYAIRQVNYTAVRMHRLIINAPDGMEVDHIDGDGLNNQRENLRLCTHAENVHNRKFSVRNKSGFKGVDWRENAKKFRAQIKVNGKKIHLGLFINPTDAALAYDDAAKESFGKFAKTNF